MYVVITSQKLILQVSNFSHNIEECGKCDYLFTPTDANSDKLTMFIFEPCLRKNSLCQLQLVAINKESVDLRNGHKTHHNIRPVTELSS